eukprot:s8313_g2.t1
MQATLLLRLRLCRPARKSRFWAHASDTAASLEIVPSGTQVSLLVVLLRRMASATDALARRAVQEGEQACSLYTLQIFVADRLLQRRSAFKIGAQHTVRGSNSRKRPTCGVRCQTRQKPAVPLQGSDAHVRVRAWGAFFLMFLIRFVDERLKNSIK